MNEMMNFPDTWEEYEKFYGFNDSEEIYTNNSRLIPSFRVKQWLDHLSSVQQEQLDCEDCIKHGGDWECDRVHCRKGDAPDTNVGKLISRQDAIRIAEQGQIQGFEWQFKKLCELPSTPLYTEAELQTMQDMEWSQMEKMYELGRADALQRTQMSPTEPEQKKGKWIKIPEFCGDDVSGFIDNHFSCSECKKEAEINSWGFYILSDFCPNCGADMRGEQDETD